MTFTPIIVVVSIVLCRVSCDVSWRTKHWNEIKCAMGSLDQNYEDYKIFIEAVLLRQGALDQYKKLKRDGCKNNKSLPRDETLSEFIRRNDTVLGALIRNQTCGDDLSIDNYDRVSLIAITASMHLNHFVCEMVHTSRDVVRLAIGTTRTIDVQRLVTGIRMHQKIFLPNQWRENFLASKNRLQCLNVKMIEDEIAENQGRILLYKQINHDDWNEFDPAPFPPEIHGRLRRIISHHTLYFPHDISDRRPGQHGEHHPIRPHGDSRRCQRNINKPVVHKFLLFSTIVSSALLRGVRIYDNNMPCSVEYLDYLSKHYGTHDHGFTQIDIESIINKIQTGLSLNSNSCPKIHQPFSHSWHHSHGKRAAMGHHGLQALLKNGHSLSDFGGLNRHDNDRGQKHPNDFSDKRACRGHNSWDLQDLNVEWDTNKLNFTDRISVRDIMELTQRSRNRISKAEFVDVCPVILYSLLQTTNLKNDSDKREFLSKPTDIETYGFGTLSTLIISLASCVGALFVKLTKSQIRDYMMGMLLSLSIGCLVGDAVLHLISEILEDEGHNDEIHVTRISGTLTKQCALLASIYAFFLLELTFSILQKQSTQPKEYSIEQNEDVHEKSDKENDKTSLVWMIIIGDAIHNFADGLAIGAAFSKDITVGLSTSIAVFCHELPHELGDFAALINSGLSVKRALLLNFTSSLTAFIGLYIGIVASSNDVARSWIFAAGAGMFMYIALANLVPEVLEYFKKTTNMYMFLSLNFGLLLGYVSMLLLAIYESDIKLSS